MRKNSKCGIEIGGEGAKKTVSVGLKLRGDDVGKKVSVGDGKNNSTGQLLWHCNLLW